MRFEFGFWILPVLFFILLIGFLFIFFGLIEPTVEDVVCSEGFELNYDFDKCIDFNTGEFHFVQPYICHGVLWSYNCVTLNEVNK